MDPDPILSIILATLFTPGVIISLIALVLLIISSGLISGSEVAFFSLTKTDLGELKEGDSPSDKRIVALMEYPKYLLATILISNNFINIAIVIVSAYLVDVFLGQAQLLDISAYIYHMGLGNIASIEGIARTLNFLITVVGVTFILVLFGEIAPKIYANLNNRKFASFMSRPLTILSILFRPFSSILVQWSTKMENRIKNYENYQSTTSKEDLDAAIELTVIQDEDSSEEQADILKGIVKFGDVMTRQIMKSRVDIIAIDEHASFKEVISLVKESGYSRIPVFREDLDTIVGLLYAKDLIGYLHSEEHFKWQEFIRTNVLYVPESKRIDDLLKEFQLKRMHMAIVVDEYGGCSGLVTLEDIMEEVVGDIKDEFDEDEEVEYVLLNDGNYIFEGKTLLNDVCRIMGLELGYFDKIRGEADSIAGLVLEIIGSMPKIEKEIEYRELVIKVVSVSKRRIEKINIQVK